jgi:hypothetical protein
MPGLLRRDRRRGRRRGTMNEEGSNDQEEPEQPVQDVGSSFSDDTVKELEKLADLRDKGIITDKEFDKKKKLILGI